MKTWDRAGIAQRCGGCGATIPAGDPRCTVKATRYEGAKGDKGPGPLLTFVRCAPCAGEPVPSDLPPYEDPQTPIRPMVHIRQGVGLLPLDFKQGAAHDRDPGED